MLVADAGGTSAPDRARAGPGPVRFVRLPGAALAALVDGDVARASAAAGVTLTGYLALDGEASWNGRINLRGPACLPVTVG